jgi:hypothetical protein
MVVVGSLTLRRVMRHTWSDGRHVPSTETTEYLQADRKREEHRGAFGYWLRPNGRTIYRPTPRTALIKRCDLQQIFLINFEDREFTEWPIQPLPTREELNTRPESGPTSDQPAPTVLVETETVDTGERRELFGRSARHVITTEHVTPLIGSTRRERQSVTDGWYIDLDTAITCEPWWWSGSAHALVALHKQGDPPERPTFKDIGERERGSPILRRTTERASVVELEVTELSTAPLHPALFAVPADFSCVEHIRQEPIPPLVIRLAQTYERLKRRARIGS